MNLELFSDIRTIFLFFYQKKRFSLLLGLGNHVLKKQLFLIFIKILQIFTDYFVLISEICVKKILM